MGDIESSRPALPDQNHVAYRVSGIPEGLSIEKTTRLLEQSLDVTDLKVESLAMDSNGCQGQVASITLNTPCKKLLGKSDEWDLPAVASQVAFGYIVVDKHFHGFTPLYAPKEEDHTIDCIAISGLGAHAFGSWKARNSSYMWLRDALPRDLPKARVLIYGYESTVAGSESFQNLGDIASSFRASLKEVTSNMTLMRPFIFIAHSLGGLVLKQALLQMATSEDEDDARHLKETSDILFFGVPNQGMELSSLYPMAHGQLNLAFLSTLDRNSVLLQNLMTEFHRIVLGDTRIISFYETHKSPTARQDSLGRWSMSGEHAVFVDRWSATSGRPWDKTLPIDRNHSNMVKFRRMDNVYNTVRGYLKKSAKLAPAVMYDEPRRMLANPSTSAPVEPQVYPSVNVQNPRSTSSVSNLPEALQALSAAGFKMKDSQFSLNEALPWAVQHGNGAAVRWLLQEAKENSADVNSYSSLAPDRQPLLSIAASKNFQSIAWLLLDWGADINADNKLGQTALHHAARKGHQAIVLLLLERGAYINAKDSRGYTSLHNAARYGHEAIMLLLLERGADIRAKDSGEYTSLHLAAEYGHEAIVHLLLEKGADINTKYRSGGTALHVAASYEHEAIVHLLLERDADVNAKTRSGQNALHRAVWNGHEAIVHLLIERGADINAKCQSGTTALHVAAWKGHVVIVRMLLERGADTNAESHLRQTALHQAAENGHEAIVHLLLERGADINAESQLRQTALHQAAENGHEEIVRLLQKEMLILTQKPGRDKLHYIMQHGRDTKQ